MREVTDSERDYFICLTESGGASLERYGGKILNEADVDSSREDNREACADGGGCACRTDDAHTDRIGTYNEKFLHRLLKCYFEPDSSFHEVPVGKYIADIKNGSLITEIQTSSLSGIRKKLDFFLRENRVRIVFPLETTRYIIWVDPIDGSLSKRNRSPKPDNKFTLLAELVYILDFLSNPNLTVTAVCMAVNEYRLLDGWDCTRKRGSTRLERVPTDIFGTMEFSSADDYVSLVPIELPSSFTREDFSALTGLRRRRLWAGLKVLETTGFIERRPSCSRKYSYTLTEKCAPSGTDKKSQ